jgi:hypothetical protein
MRRYDIERAALAARLPGPQVAIVLALCTRIYRDQGMIPPAGQPSYNQLAADTGYHRSTIIRHVRRLEQAGWVIAIRPPAWQARQHHITNSYAMQAPANYPQARGGLVAQRDQAGSTAHLGLVAQRDQAGSTARPELVAQRDQAGSTARPSFQTAESRDTDRAPACPHGVTGGDRLMRSGRIRCPLCRMAVSDG